MLRCPPEADCKAKYAHQLTLPHLALAAKICQIAGKLWWQSFAIHWVNGKTCSKGSCTHFVSNWCSSFLAAVDKTIVANEAFAA